MIGVFVDHDRIGIPQPVGNVVIVGRGNTKVEAANPEALSISSYQTENVTRSKSAREATVFKRMIQMEARIVPAGIMSYPLVVGVDVRSFGVSRLIGETAAFRRGGAWNLRWPWRGGAWNLRWCLGSGRSRSRRRAMGGNVPVTDTTASALGWTLASAVTFVIALIITLLLGPNRNR